MLKYVKNLAGHPYLQKITGYVEVALFTLCILGVVMGVFIVLSTKFDIPGGYRLFTVETESMEPKLPVGSAVLVRIPQELAEIYEDDIITFEQPGFENKYITHRVYEKLKRDAGEVIATKGDANPRSDSWLIAYGNIRGIYYTHIPYLGKIINIIQTPLGVGLLIIFPALVIIIQELRNILKVLWDIKLKQLKKKSATIATFLAIGVLLGLSVTSQSYALLSTAPVTLLGSSITTGTWDVPGEVVINEIMWMGSAGNSADEWIELRNMTDDEIDLSGWQLTKWADRNHEDLMLTIPSGKTIPAGGYFLIANYSEADSAMNVTPNLVDTDIVLVNEYLQVKLYRGDWTDNSNLVDTADDGNGKPFAGKNSSVRQSMERNSSPGDGTAASSWHTCISDTCNDGNFWDTHDGDNYGTPGSENHSENDLSIMMANPLILPDEDEDSEASNSTSPTSSPTPDPQQPEVERFALGADSTTVSFSFNNLIGYKSMQYTITYSAYGIVRGIGPSEVDIAGKDEYASQAFDLGTCSSDVCTYDKAVHDFTLEVALTDSSGHTLQLEHSF